MFDSGRVGERLGNTNRLPAASAFALARISMPGAKRYPVFPPRLHPLRWNCPEPALGVDLVPGREPHLTSPCRRQDQELEGNRAGLAGRGSQAATKAGTSAYGRAA